MAVRRWRINQISQEKSRILSEEYGLPRLVTDILAGRGLDMPYMVEEFLSEDGVFEDPFALPDMERAADRIRQALDSGEKIAVYGDYDCDGVTATAILYQYLASVGADVCYYIPERDGEGYGLNRTALDQLSGEGVTLLVTVDNGISAAAEIQYAARLGMEVVVTDHHQPGEILPEAAAVVDPHRSDCTCDYRSFCGAGIALKLVAALEDGSMERAVEYFGDLAAIGTIGDVVPLTGENRLLVRQGLRLLQNSESLGLNALVRAAGFEGKALTAENVAFGIVPRINAAGRMGSAGLAIKLLLSEEEEEAQALTDELQRLNQERQQKEAEIMADIERILTEHPEKLNERVLVLAGEGWHHGVVGIVSARVLERFSKPNFLISIEGSEARGSGRSCGEFSLFKALSACSGLLTKFGGHKQAAGLSLLTENIDAFAGAVNAYAKTACDEMPQVTLELDRELRAEELRLEAIEPLELLQPFGAENQSPVFVIRNVTITGLTPLSENKHTKLQLRDEHGASFQALCFGRGTEQLGYGAGEAVDLAASVGINEYGGRKSVSVKLKDIRPAGFEEERFFSAKAAYEKLRRGETIDPRLKKRAVPAREDIAFLYKLLRKNNGYPLEADLLYLKLWKTRLSYCQFRFALDILAELGLIRVGPLGEGIELLPVEGKADLNASRILHTLMEQPALPRQ